MDFSCFSLQELRDLADWQVPLSAPHLPGSAARQLSSAPNKTHPWSFASKVLTQPTKSMLQKSKPSPKGDDPLNMLVTHQRHGCTTLLVLYDHACSCVPVPCPLNPPTKPHAKGCSPPKPRLQVPPGSICSRACLPFQLQKITWNQRPNRRNRPSVPLPPPQSAEHHGEGDGGANDHGVPNAGDPQVQGPRA